MSMNQNIRKNFGGEGGIRTHGTVNRTLDFESSPFDHSGTSPSAAGEILGRVSDNVKREKPSV